MSTKFKPLDDLELYEVIVAAYPEKFNENGNTDIWDEVQEFAEELCGGNVDELCELLGRVVTLTMPTCAALSGKMVHAIGQIEIKDGHAHMTAAVRREVHL